MIGALLLAAALAAPAEPPSAAAPPQPAAGAAPAPAPTPPPSAAVRRFSGDRPGQLSADEVRLNFRTRQVTVVGKPLVTLIHDDATLTCKRLTGENDAAGRLKVAVCEGDVKLVRVGRVVTCDRATYDRGAGRVVCTGHTLLKDPGGTEASAATLTYDLTSDEVILGGGAQFTVPGSEIDAGMPSLKATKAPPAPAPADGAPAGTPPPAAVKPGGAP